MQIDQLIADKIEHDLTTRFCKNIWRKFLSAMQRYRMVRPGDRIAVCLSGGKDSLLLGKCLQLLQRYSKIPFELVFLNMDPGYSQENMEIVLTNAHRIGLAPESFKTDILSIVDAVDRSPCHICAAMRRGHLYKEAQARGCNKIALGHHSDDVVETIMISLLYGGEFKTMMPRLRSDNFPQMELIRPLYLVRENDIKTWQNAYSIKTVSCACRITRKDGGKRAQVKKMLAEFEREQPNIHDNIFSASDNVNLSTILGYRYNTNTPTVSFLDFPEGYHTVQKNAEETEPSRLF